MGERSLPEFDGGGVDVVEAVSCVEDCSRQCRGDVVGNIVSKRDVAGNKVGPSIVGRNVDGHVIRRHALAQESAECAADTRSCPA